MSDIVMPRLSDSMEEGTILRWLKQDGEQVKRGEELVEIETDKANMTYESDRDGVLQTVAAEGDTLQIGEVIARIGDHDAPVEPSTAEQAAVVEQAPVVEPPAANGTPGGHVTRAQSAPAASGSAGRVKASPLARRIAREQGVELTALSGSGPGGRIVKADVEAARHGQPAAVEGVMAAKGESTFVDPTRTQRTIARRMAESKATIPDFTLQVDVDMEHCVVLRGELKRLSHDDAPTYNDMVVKACALALREHPRANGSYKDGGFELHERVNVGVAVAVDPEDPIASALVVPTVLDADRKALGEIARETRSLAQRVRDGSITPPELSGTTFTVSNLGMYGIRSFSAIINPPQAAILAVGAVQERPVVLEGEIAPGQRMTMTLSCDHRILYGADAALFLARVRELLEEPAALTL